MIRQRRLSQPLSAAAVIVITGLLRLLRAFVLALSALLRLSCAYAQSEDLSFNAMGVKAGLPHQNVTKILQDHRGYMWFGTETGLTRYDGSQFHTYVTDPTDPTALGDPYISALHEDSDGQLWVGTLNKGLYRRRPDGESWEHINLDDAATSPRVRRAVWAMLDGPPCQGDEPGLWIGTSDGLKFLHVRTGRIETFRNDPLRDASLRADSVYALAFDAQCRLWIGSAKGVQYRVAGSNRFVVFPIEAESSATPSRVQALLIDHAQTLWVGSRSVFAAWDMSAADPAQARLRFRQRVSSSQEEAVGLIEDHRHHVWAVTLGGLQRWNLDHGLVHTYVSSTQDKHTLPSAQLMSVYQGRDEVLWVGTFDAGVAYTDLGTQGFRRFRHRDGDAGSLVDDQVWRLAGETDDSALWIGTRAGVSRLDRRTGVATSYRHDPRDARSLQSGEVEGIVVDSANQVSITTDDGIDIFDATTRAFRHVPLSNPIVEPRLSTRGDSGTLWIGTQSGQLHHVDVASGGVTLVPLDDTHDASPSVVVVSALLLDDGLLWIGSQTSVARLNLATRTTTHYHHIDGDPTTPSYSRITDIYRDREGRYWVGTGGGGLDRMDVLPNGSARFHAYTHRDGLGADLVGATLQDASGALWISTIAGLSRFDPASGSFTNFTESEGLLEGGYFVGSAYAAADGMLYFGGPHGLTEVNPAGVATNATAPEVAITAVDVLDRRKHEPLHVGVMNRAEAAQRPLVLPYTTAVVSFDAAALHFADPARNKISYKLEPFDRDWRVFGAGQHVATYTNLDPSHYVFRVKAAGKNGIWSEPLALDVTVTPPFWATWWFRLLAAAAVAGAIYAAFRLRVHEIHLEANQRRLQEVSQHKSEFLATMSHEIRTPMNAVIGLVHLSLRERGLSERIRSYLSKIHVSAAALLRILDDILDSSKIEAGRLDIERVGFLLDDLLSHAITVTEQKAAEKGLALTFSVTPECPRQLIGDPLRLGQVVINLVNNAIKFTERGEVSVRCEVDHTEGEAVWLRWSVRDTGIGMTAEQLANLFQPFVQADTSISRKYGGTGLGLSISRRLVELMGGQLQAQSAVGVGTTFTWILPFECARDDQVVSAAEASEQEVHDYASARVLLVEDNEINQLIASELMTGAGLSVDVVDSGEAAVQRIGDAPAKHYAVVLMDLQMPGMDGFAATRAIQALPQGADLPIIALTAHAAQEIQRRCTETGMRGCLSKPFHPVQLFAALDRFIPGKVPRRHRTASMSTTFNPHRGLVCMDGNEHLYADVLRRFSTSAPKAADELLRAMSAGDTALATRTAHTLRGLASMIGALDLADAAARLESALGAGESTAQSLATEMAMRVPPALAEIAQYLERATPVKEKPVATTQLAREDYLATLRELLANGSGRTRTWVGEGRALLVEELGETRAQQLEQKVEAFDFAAALRVLDQQE